MQMFGPKEEIICCKICKLYIHRRCADEQGRCQNCAPISIKLKPRSDPEDRDHTRWDQFLHKYVEEDDCMEAVYMELTASGNLIRVIDMINEGTPLDEMAQVILYKGYTEGLWNPDLMLTLIEPTIYLLIGKNTKRINAVEIELEKQLGSTK